MRNGRQSLTFLELFAVIAIVTVLAMTVLPLLRAGHSYGYELRSCQDNLRRWHTIFTTYLNENSWYYPPVNGFDDFGPPGSTVFCGNINDDYDFSPRWRAVYPDYTTDLGLLVCPDGPNSLAHASGGPSVNAVSLGIIQSVRAGHCIYEGFPTNKDASYTYLGWRVDRADDGDPYIDRETAMGLGLTAEGPAQIVALLAQVGPNVTLPPRFSRSGKKRRQLVPLEPVVMAESLGSLGDQVNEWGNKNGGEILNPLWKGFFFGEKLVDQMAKMADEMMKIGEYDPETMANPPERDFWASTPVMWDSVSVDESGEPRFVHQNPNGANVLFMDGHVEFITYPGKFPMSKSFARTRPVPIDGDRPRVYINGTGPAD